MSALRSGLPAARGRRGRPGVGFTLIELLVALALMSVLAVLGWRGLDSILSTRDRLTQASDDLRALSASFAQMEEDLRRAWPVRLLNLEMPIVGFVMSEEGGVPVLQLVRELPAGMASVPLQRVVYRQRGRVFERGFAAWTQPSTQAGASVSVAPLTWQTLLEDVEALQFRAWVQGSGWQPAAALLWTPGQEAPAASVTGVEVTLLRGNGDRVQRVFNVRD